MSDLVRKLPIQYTHPDGVDVNGGGGGGNSSSPQNDYVQRSELAEVAFTGDYDDLADKPINESERGNSMFEPINDSMLINNGSLIFALNYPISDGSYFIIKIPTYINTDIPNGIILRYNGTNYFNGINIHLFNEYGTQIEDATIDYIKSYIGYPGMLICWLHDGDLYIRRFNLSEFASGFAFNNFIKQKDIANLEVTPMNAKIGELYYNNYLWRMSIQDMSNYEFCIIALMGDEYELKPLNGLSDTYYPSFYGHVVFARIGSTDYPILFCTRNNNAKTFLIQKGAIGNRVVYKLYDLDYFSYIFGFCYISTLLSNTPNSYLAIVLPYNKDLLNGSVKFILETHLDSDVVDNIDTCKILYKSGQKSDCQITLNGNAIDSSNPLKKDCYYTCNISTSGTVTLTRN